MHIKSAESCDYDILSLGEILLRLDPGPGRIRTARSFSVWEGGGEYNVARGLRKCFGLRGAVVTAFVDNEVGHLLEDFVMQGGGRYHSYQVVSARWAGANNSQRSKLH